MWDKYRQIDNYRPERHYWTACDADGAVLFRSPKGFKTEKGAIDDWNNTVAKIYDTGSAVGEKLLRDKIKREQSEKSKAAHDTAFKSGKEEGYNEGYALGFNKGEDAVNVKMTEEIKKVEQMQSDMQFDRKRLISRCLQAVIAAAVGAFLIGAFLV